MKLTAHLHLVLTLNFVELHLDSPCMISCHGSYKQAQVYFTFTVLHIAKHFISL